MILFRTFLASVVMAVSVGCEKPAVSPAGNAATSSDGPVAGVPGTLINPATGKARILALGDSYTIGESVPPAERFPNQLAAALRAKGIACPDAAILARTGWTTDELLSGMDRAGFADRYDVVTVLIGVNNEFRGYRMDDFRPSLKTILDRATKLAGDKASHVIIVSIPDWGVTPMNDSMGRKGVSAEIDAYNAVCKTEANEHGMAFVDITDISRQVPQDKSLCAPDGLHPSGSQYKLWIERLAPAAEKILK